MTAVVC